MPKAFCQNGARGMSSTREWARQASSGDYLICWHDSGLSDSEDPGSRGGYSDDEIAEIDRILGERDLILRADNLGLVARFMVY